MRPRRSTLLLAVVLLGTAGAGLHGAAGGTTPATPRSELARCSFLDPTAERTTCYAEVLQAQVDAGGIDATLVDVDEERVRSRRFARECHVALHPVGAAAGRALAQNGDAIPALTPRSFCHEGYVHGLTIAFMESASVGTLVRKGALLCSGQDVETGWSCSHSLGHLFAQRSRSGMLGAGSLCSRASEPAVGRLPFEPDVFVASCVKGAIMELDMAAARVGRELDRSEVCTGVRKPVALPCYAFLPVGLLGDTDPLAPAEPCLTAVPPGKAQDACISVFARALESPDTCSALDDRHLRDVCRREAAFARVYDPNR